jgi:hypothetical protein
MPANRLEHEQIIGMPINRLEHAETRVVHPFGEVKNPCDGEMVVFLGNSRRQAR